MTAAEISERLDLDHIAHMARRARTGLRLFGVARVELTPDDGTRYEIIVTNLRLTSRDGSLRRYGGDYVVSLVNCSGSSYYWNGGHMESGYVTVKWVADDRLWTGVVLTEFLNALSAELETT